MSTLDHRLKPEATAARRLEVITGTGRRRWFSADDKARMIEETLVPGAVVSEVARRHGFAPQQLLIEGGLPTEATIAQVLVCKYADHLPLYRQAQIYARQGIDLDRSTLADWVGHAAWHLRPLHERLLDEAQGIAQAVRGRDHRAGARSWPRPHQDRAAMGLCRR